MEAAILVVLILAFACSMAMIYSAFRNHAEETIFREYLSMCFFVIMAVLIAFINWL